MRRDGKKRCAHDISCLRSRGKAAKRDALKRDERACRGGFQRDFTARTRTNGIVFQRFRLF